MVILSILFVLATVQEGVPPVPGLCSDPVPANRDTPGCYKTNELNVAGAPPSLYWHIYESASLEAAQAEVRRHRWAAVAKAHSRVWLYILGGSEEAVTGPVAKQATIGPLAVPDGPVTAHFAESVFPPGMRTRIHSHPGPEAFYVVEGEQCMESPSDQALISPGGTYIVPGGPHLQASPHGRRNLVLILAPKDAPFVIPGGDGWQSRGFCAPN